MSTTDHRQGDMQMTDPITRDAEEFGRHVKGGGWLMGLLVARNVEPDTGDGVRLDHRKEGANAFAPSKVSAREFARRSTISDPTVKRYLLAWDAAAADGHVPPSADLKPTDDVALDVDALPSWKQYYPPRESNTAALTPTKRESYQSAADEYGTSLEQVSRTAASRKAIAAAILADDAVALAARDALRKVDTRRPREEVPPSMIVKETHHANKAVMAFQSIREKIEAAIGMVAASDIDLTDFAHEEADWLRNAADSLVTASRRSDVDGELLDMLSRED